MCNIGLIAAGVQVGAGVMQARNQYKEGMAAASYQNYQAKVAEQEAEMATRIGAQQTRLINQQASFQSKRLARDQAKEGSSQRAAMAAAGIQGGTAGDIEQETVSNHLLDQATLRYNADVDAYGVQSDATYRSYAAKSQAAQFRTAANYSKSAAKRNAFTTLLGTATTVAAPFMFKPFTSAIPGLGGYGLRTPLGTQNMGNYSLLPGR